MESGFKCGSGEPDSSFCVMMDILYHVPHLCGGFFAIFNELNSKTYYAAYTRGKNIPENADLNDYLNTGVYYVRDSNIAATIKNYPPGVSSGGRLEVCELASGWKHQNFYPNDSADMYIRFANGSPWYKITAQQLQSE